MQWVTQLVSTLAWPLTALAMVILLRQEIRRVTKRLSAVSYKDLKAEFREDLEEAESHLTSLPETKVPASESERDAIDLPPLQRLLRIAEISPRAAVVDAWADVEAVSREIVRAYGLDSKHTQVAEQALGQLVTRGVLSSHAVEAYARLRRVRNMAAHEPEFVASWGTENTIRSIRSMWRLRANLLSVLQDAQGGKAEE